MSLSPVRAAGPKNRPNLFCIALSLALLVHVWFCCVRFSGLSDLLGTMSPKWPFYVALNVKHRLSQSVSLSFLC